MLVDSPALLNLCFRAKRTRGMHDTSYQVGRSVRRYSYADSLKDHPNPNDVWADLAVDLLELSAADLLFLNTTLTPLQGSVESEPLSLEKIRAAVAQLPNPHCLPVGVLLDPTGLRQLCLPREKIAVFTPGDAATVLIGTPCIPVREGVHTGAAILLPETEAAHKATFHCVRYPGHTTGFPYQREIEFPWGSLRCGYRESRGREKIEFRVCSEDHFFVGGEGVAIPYSE